MAYTVTHLDALCRLGSEGSTEELELNEALERGLNYFEGQGFTLVQAIQPLLIDSETQATQAEMRFIFHKGPRTVLDDLREKYADMEKPFNG